MKLLNIQEAQFISGGNVNVGLTMNIADESVHSFAAVLGNFLTGQLDPTQLAAAINENPDVFYGMRINGITIENFNITPR